MRTTSTRAAWGLAGALALCLALAPQAVAASVSPAATRQAEAYEKQMFEQMAAVTAGQLQAAKSQARADIQPCFSQAMTKMTSNDALVHSRYTVPAFKDLAEEAAEAYAIGAMKPEMAPLLTFLNKASRLKVPAKDEAGVRKYTEAFTAWQKIHVCHDATRWEAAGLKPSSEPAGIKTMKRLNSVFKSPGNFNPPEHGPMAAVIRRGMAKLKASVPTQNDLGWLESIIERTDIKLEIAGTPGLAH